ncbi:MAG: hypothetical protein IPP71_03900 [Bacteroidetes bacterium]|nr:hypothetical protein [Bacteroidota bacterium]
MLIYKCYISLPGSDSGSQKIPFSSPFYPFGRKLIAKYQLNCYFVIVKAIVSIFLSFYLLLGSLFPGNSFANFSELPILFQHYMYHYKVETPGISVFEFMSLHYNDDAHEKSDLAHHNKLPLHHHLNTTPLDEIVYSNGFEKLLNSAIGLKNNKPVLNNILLSFDTEHGIFHPPKV